MSFDLRPACGGFNTDKVLSMHVLVRALLLCVGAAAFVTPGHDLARLQQRRLSRPVCAPRSANVVMSAAALPMPKSSVPIGRLSVDVKGKTLTPLGLWFGIMSFAWAFVM